MTGWSAGPCAAGRPVAAAKRVHWPTVTGVRAIRNAGTWISARGASFMYLTPGSRWSDRDRQGGVPAFSPVRPYRTRSWALP